MMKTAYSLVPVWLALLTSTVTADVYNSFDGEGFPTCYNVTTVHEPTSVDESRLFLSLFVSLTNNPNKTC